MGNVLEEVLLTRSSQLSIRRGGENVLLYILGPSCFSEHNEKLFKNCYRLGSMLWSHRAVTRVCGGRHCLFVWARRVGRGNVMSLYIYISSVRS